MSPNPHALVFAAEQLRRQARIVEQATGSLSDPGGPDTWTGPAADRHRAHFGAARTRAGTVVDRLRAAATALDHDADVLLWTTPVDPASARRSGAQL